MFIFARHLIATGLLVALAFGIPARSRAAEKEKSATDAAAGNSEAPTKEKKSTRVPFHGKLGAVDKTAMTISLDGKEKKRVIAVTSHTKITKAGKPATLADAAPGEEVAGQLVKSAEGKEEAISLRIGPKPEEASPKKKSTEQ